MGTFTEAFIRSKLDEIEIADQIVKCSVLVGSALSERLADGMKIVVECYQNGYYRSAPEESFDEKHFRLSVFDTMGDFFIKTLDFPVSLITELTDVMNYCQTAVVNALPHFDHFERWVIDSSASGRELSCYGGDHYRYLEHVLPVFGAALPFLPAVKAQLGLGIISAHGDKSRQYRTMWVMNGVPYLHGCLLHLLSYTSFCNDLEGHLRGDWVIERYPDYLPLIQLVEAEVVSQIKKKAETLRRDIARIKENS